VREAALNGSGLPVGVLAAAVLAAEQVSFVLVGSAALWLRGEQVSVGDADVVIEPVEPNLRRLREALAGLAVRPETLPAVHRLRELPVATAVTSYGRVDCLLEQGRRDWHQLHHRAGYVAVADALVLVASADDVQILTARGDDWFACLPAAGTPPEVMRDQLLKVHGVTIYVSVGQPRPLPTMIRTWTRNHQHEDLQASLTALENALASRQQKRLTEYD
jgi:hypothetical protein